MKARYLISCAAAAILSGSALAANAADADSTGVARPGDATATVTDASTDAAASDTAAVADIIVTAERRSENVQAVPMTVTALTATAISQENISTLDEIIKYTPNVTFGGN